MRSVRFISTSTIRWAAVKNYYQVLQVPKDATKKDLKKKFYELSKKYHPDMNPGNDEAHAKFLEINEAYSTLSDDDKRAAYDFDARQSSGHAADGGRAYGQQQQPFSRSSFRQRSQINPDDWIQYKRSTGASSAYGQSSATGSGHYSNPWSDKRDAWRAQNKSSKLSSDPVSEATEHRRILFKVIGLMAFILIAPDLLQY